MVEAFLVGGARTPVGRYGGALPPSAPMIWPRWWSARPWPGPASIRTASTRSSSATPTAPARRTATSPAWPPSSPGFPLHIPGITVNRLCASGLSAIIMASQMIKSGAADIVVAGGVESMSRAPWVQEKPRTAFAKPGEIFDTSIGWRFVNPLFTKGELSRDGKMTYSMPETAEEVGRVDGISREDADAFAVRSHERALAAIDAGRFADEIVPVTVKTRKGETVVDTDEGPRAGTTMDVLAGLRPVVAGRLGCHRGQLLHPQRRRLRHHRRLGGRDPEAWPHARAPASSTAPRPAASPRSWASARSRPRRRSSSAAA